MAAGSSKVVLKINILQDETPEFESWFHVNLTSVSSGASIQRSRSRVNVTILDSDYPFGRIAFGVNSRYKARKAFMVAFYAHSNPHNCFLNYKVSN